MARTKAKPVLSPFATTENHSSDKPLLIDADQTAVAVETLKTMIGGLTFLHELLAKGTATVGTRHNTLSIARHGLNKIEDLLGAKDDQSQEEALKKNLLRQANTEVARLREELGKGVTVEGIGSKLHQMQQHMYHWWQNQGFSYSEMTLNPSHSGAAFHVKFSVNVDRHVSRYAEKPVTAKIKKDAKMAALGEQLQLVHNDQEPYVLDNENNRTWITNLLKARFPGCSIWKWESICIYRLDGFCIRHVEVRIDIASVGDVVEKGSEDF